MDADELCLFLDTNTILHYPQFAYVDWLAAAGTTKVRLVLCMQVIHELDSKKDDARLGERASIAIKEIRRLLKENCPVRDRVTLEVFNYEVRREDFPDTLSF